MKIRNTIYKLQKWALTIDILVLGCLIFMLYKYHMHPWFSQPCRGYFCINILVP